MLRRNFRQRLAAAGHGGDCLSCGGTRRQFVASLAAAGVGALLPAPSVRAQTPAAPPGMIDVHHHTVPPFWFEEVKDRITQQGGGRIVPGWLNWSPQRAIEEMDRNGIATAIASISTPGIWYGDIAQSRRLSRQCNEYAAQLARDYPGRFGLFAALPLPDIEGSLKEVEYAFDVLRANGIGLLTSYGDKWLGDAAFAPVLDEINRRKGIIYVHPAAPGCCTSLMSYVPPFLTEFTQDTNRAILSLMYSGSLGRLRDTRFIFSHAGGTIPMLAGRITQLGNLPFLVEKVPNGVEYELKRLYYEIANSANRPAIAALTNLVPMSQIMFGSDYPLVPIPATAGGLDKLDLSAADLQALRRDNAVALMPRLRT
jgi:predicted TIM-barrel fold metal-dependent hydrolase